MSEDLSAERVGALLDTVRWGRSLDVRAETGSTNDDAREAATAGAPTDVTGTWRLVAEGGEHGALDLTLDLEQRDDAVEGLAQGRDGVAEVRGAVRDGRVWLSLDQRTERGLRTVKLRGTLKRGAMRGRHRAGAAASGDRRARRDGAWRAERR